MSVIQIGLVDTTGQLDEDLVRTAAAALNMQVIRDVPQFWPVQGTVIYLPDMRKVPSGVWPVQLVSHLPPNKGGFHRTTHHEPYAKVLATTQNDGWTVAASHEVVEMLVDPYGSRLQTSTAIEVIKEEVRDRPGQFAYLVEACDPCEADTFAYDIQGIAVSDFVTPNYYDPVAMPGIRYSFTGAITEPRQVLSGGYVSWIDEEKEECQQLRYLDATPQIFSLGSPKDNLSLREWIDAQMSGSKLQTPRHISGAPRNHTLLQRCRAHRNELHRIATARAKLFK